MCATSGAPQTRPLRYTTARKTGRFHLPVLFSLSDTQTYNLPAPSLSSATPTQRSVGGASTHSISSGATPPDRLRFPRGTASRSTFHGGQLRDRRTATYNGPPASPSLSHDATPLSQSRARGSTNLFSKLTSKLTRRYARAEHHGSCSFLRPGVSNQRLWSHMWLFRPSAAAPCGLNK